MGPTKKMQNAHNAQTSSPKRTLITQKSKHASEEGSSNNLPYPKTVQLPNIIERFMPSLGNLIGILSTQDDSDYEKY